MKGQWFLISAVIASGAFLTISLLFKEYFVTNPSDVASINEDYYFHNILQQFNKVVAQSSCADLDRNLREFRAFAERRMGNLGYLLFLNYTSGCNPTPGIMLASDRMTLCQNVNSKDVLPNVIILSCS